MSLCSMNLITNLFEEEIETSTKEINDLDIWWRNNSFLQKYAGIRSRFLHNTPQFD